MQCGPGIQQEIAGPAVEAEHPAVGRQAGQVADAADVDDDAVAFRMAEQCGMKSRHQRRTLAAGSDIAAPEVGDHGDAGQFGQQRRICQAEW